MIKNIVTDINKFAVKTGFYLYFVSLFAALLLVFSVIPTVGNGINSGLHAHIIGYSVLSFSTLLLFRSKQSDNIYLKTILLAGGYGIFIEAVQFFVPYRLFEFADIVINFAASAAGILPGYILIKNKWI